MKRTIVFSLLLTFLSLLGMSQTSPQVTLEGNFYDYSSTPIPFQPFWVTVTDSIGTGIYYSSSSFADSNGHFQHDITINNLPGTLHGTLSILDGGGLEVSYFFDVTSTYTLLSGNDYHINPSVPPCAARWTHGYPTWPTTTAVFVNRSQQGANSYAWDFGDGATSTAVNPSHTYATNGNYNVCLQVTGPQGCISAFCDTVRIGVLGSPHTVELHYGQIGPYRRGLIAVTEAIEKASMFHFSVANSFSYQRFENTMAIDPHNWPALPCVEVEFTDSSWAQACLPLMPDPDCQAEFYTLTDRTGQYSLLIVDNSYGNQITYLWDFGDGDTSTLAHPQHTYAGPGTYNLCVSIADSGGFCTRTFCDSITVSNKISTPFTIQVVNAMALSTEPVEEIAPQIALYPNPANLELELRLYLTRATHVSLDILDLQGRLVRRQDWGMRGEGEQHLEVDVQALPAGLYMARIEQGGQQVVKRLLIAR